MNNQRVGKIIRTSDKLRVEIILFPSVYMKINLRGIYTNMFT